MACVAKRRGRYVIDFYDTYGKRRWITLPKGSTKKRANEALREIEDHLRKGIYIPDKKIPIFNWSPSLVRAHSIFNGTGSSPFGPRFVVDTWIR